MLEWIKENPAFFALAWPAFTAVVSVLYKYADGIPRLHAFLSVLVGAGFDLPKVLDALRRWLTGEDPPSPPQMKAVGSVRECKDVKDPPAVTRMGLLAACLAVCLCSCSWLSSSHVVDVVQVAECVLVESAKVAPDRMPTLAEAAQIALTCSAKDAQQILDILTAERKADAIRARAQVDRSLDAECARRNADAGAKP